MELRQLEYFCMVSRLKSFTKAAEQLYISQPAITKAIRNLEEELNIQLFYRDNKQVILTLDGHAFLSQAEKILHTVQQAVAEIGDCNTREKGTLNLGVPPMIGAFVFPEIFMRFTSMYPNIAMNIIEDGSISTLGKIQKGELELGIIILPECSEGIHSIPMIQEEYVLCVHSSHPLAKETSVDLCQIKNEKFILLKPGFFQNQAIISRCRSKHFMPKIILASDQIRTIQSLVANGAGISFLMKSAVRGNRAIAAVPLSEPIKVNIGVAWRNNSPLTAASRAFIKFAKNYIDTVPLPPPCNKTMIG